MMPRMLVLKVSESSQKRKENPFRGFENNLTRKQFKNTKTIVVQKPQS